ncbi:MAG: hypothetical protein KC620_10315 [Myxococcales bacterium]|nr:hypothetical protein [Myxococcales bacterium]
MTRESKRAVGIDFGTTNSAIAVCGPDGRTRLAEFPVGETWARVFRSVLHFAPPEDGRPPHALAGPAAIARRLDEGEGRLIQSLKSFLASASFQATDIYNRRYSLEDLVGFFLAELRRMAEAGLGPLGHKAVVGRPVRFAGSEGEESEALAERRLRTALTRAGFTDVFFTFEPAQPDAPFAGRCGVSLDAPTICDPTLREAIETARNAPEAQYRESWEWHEERFHALEGAGLTEDDLVRSRALVEEFESLLARRDRMHYALDTFATQHVYTLDGEQATTLSRSAWAAVQTSLQNSALSQMSPVNSVLVRQAEKRTELGELPVYVTPEMAPEAAEDVLSDEGYRQWLALMDAKIEAKVQEAYEAGCLDPSADNPCDWQPKLFAQRVLDLYTAEREIDFQRCMDATPEGFDAVKGRSFVFADALSAHDKIDHYHDLCYGQLEGVPVWNLPSAIETAEACFELLTADVSDYTVPATSHYYGDFKGCVVRPNGTVPNAKWRIDTAGTAGAIYYMAGDKDVSAATYLQESDFTGTAAQGYNNWTRSGQHLERYFDCREVHNRVMLRVLAAALDSDLIVDGKVVVRKQEEDFSNPKDSRFAAYSSYGFGFDLGNFDDYADDRDTCLLEPEVYGYYEAGVTVLGHDFDVAHVSMHTRAGSGHSSMALPDEVTENTLEVSVFGVQVPSVNLDFNPGQMGDVGWYTIVDDGFSDGIAIAEGGATFMVGPVPVTVRGGLAGGFGVNYQAGIGRPDGCAELAVEGRVTPFAYLNAFATVSVDIIVAAIGVKAELTLLRVDLPFNMRLGIEFSGDELVLRLTGGLDLELSSLSGRFAVWARVLFVTIEETLFSWDGLRYTTNLFSIDTKSLPLARLADAAVEIRKDKYQP